MVLGSEGKSNGHLRHLSGTYSHLIVDSQHSSRRLASGRQWTPEASPIIVQDGKVQPPGWGRHIASRHNSRTLSTNHIVHHHFILLIPVHSVQLAAILYPTFPHSYLKPFTSSVRFLHGQSQRFHASYKLRRRLTMRSNQAWPSTGKSAYLRTTLNAQSVLHWQHGHLGHVLLSVAAASASAPAPILTALQVLLLSPWATIVQHHATTSPYP
jgi:hypothetical protein